MRAYLPDHEVLAPSSLAEALEAMASGKTLRPLAGGTDLMVELGAGHQAPTTYLDLHGVAELRAPLEINGSLTLRSLTTYTEVRHHPEVARRFPLLPIAAREVGVLGIQSRGTWVGNIANASPAADGVPALMAYDATIELTSKRGKRDISLAEFYKGYKRTERNPDELITRVTLPAPPAGRYEYYRKVGTRRLQAISKVILTGWITVDRGQIQDARLVYGSVFAYTLRVRQAEDALRGQPLTDATIDRARQAVDAAITPIDDIRSTGEYRREVAAALLLDFLGQVKSAEG